MKRGEIWAVDLPASVGREQSGRRPALVVQDEVYGRLSPLVLAVPLTSQISALRFPATVSLTPSSRNGLSLPSVALIFQTRALDRIRFAQRLGQIEQDVLDQILDDLGKLIGR